MNSETAKEIVRDARLLLDALDTGFHHKKWDLVMAAMPAIVTGHQMDYAQLVSDLSKIAEQAGKNRAAKEETGFTEAQVRRAVAASVHRPGSQEVRTRGLYWSTDSFAGDVIKRLREPEAVPVEGGVYKSPAGVLYKRSGAYWLTFEGKHRLADDELNYPVSELERVL